MSLAYITTDEQKAFSRIQHTALDSLIWSLIQGASVAVKNYLKDFSAYEGERDADDDYVVDSNYEPVIQLDANGDRVVKAEVKVAVMFQVHRWIHADKYPSDSMGYLCPEVTSILYPLRDPALK